MKNRTLYVFMGPPGSGKGTLAQLYTQKLGWQQISTGNLCRKHIKEQTKIGKEIDFAIKSGKLVPDDLITEMFSRWFIEHPWQCPDVILDGYPRTVAQAKRFDKLVSASNVLIDVNIIKFKIDDAKLIERLGCRYICENKECQMAYSLLPGSSLAPKKIGVCDKCGFKISRRVDDILETIKERLKIYHLHEKELTSFFENSGYSVYEIFVDKPVQDLFEEMKSMIGVLGRDCN